MSRYVVLDFETYPVNGKSYIMEIGCIEVIDGIIGNTFQTLVRPVAEVSSFVLNLTGISAEDLKKAPEFIDIMLPFYNFIQNSVIVAHNAHLDCLSYESFCQYLKIDPKPFLWVDSQDIIKIVDPTVKTLQLQTLLSFHQFGSAQSHRAKDDALGLAQLLLYYSKHFPIKLTRQEASFLKSSARSSIKQLTKFLFSNFVIELNDVFSVAESPMYNQLHSDEKQVQDNQTGHYNLATSELFDTLFNQTKPTLIITTSQCFHGVSYVSSPSTYIFPDKILRLYPLLTDDRLSHIETVELYALINWLRHTKSFLLSELNDQLIQRYNHSVRGILDTHPLMILNFVRGLLTTYFKSGHLIECHYEMFQLILTHAPGMLRDYSVVFHNFIGFNKKLSVINERELSYGSFKRLSRLVLNLAFIIEYLNYLNQDNLKFVKDFARLKSLIDQISEEKLQLFQKADYLVETLSANIFSDDKRQVYVNANVYETMEWQELLGSLNVIIHYVDEILKLLQRISFYIYSDLNSWFSDLIFEFNDIKKNIETFLNLPQDGQVMYIESYVKHRPSNCKLIIKNLYEWEFYANALQHVDSFYVHQRIFDSQNNLRQLLGFPAIDELARSVNINRDLTISFKSVSEFRTDITNTAKSGPLIIVASSKKRLRFWRHKLRSLVLSQQVDPTVQLSFCLYKDLIKRKKMPEVKIIFPEFFVPNLLQPLHQARINQFSISETNYLLNVFYEELHLMLDDLSVVDPSLIMINLDVRFKSVLVALTS